MGKLYDKYASLNVYPGEKDGKFYTNKAITRKELGKMVGGIDELKDSYSLKNFVSDNPRGTITAACLATMIQELYPSHLSSEKTDEILADCTNTENLTPEEKAKMDKNSYTISMLPSNYAEDYEVAQLNIKKMKKELKKREKNDKKK